MIKNYFFLKFWFSLIIFTVVSLKLLKKDWLELLFFFSFFVLAYDYSF